MSEIIMLDIEDDRCIDELHTRQETNRLESTVRLLQQEIAELELRVDRLTRSADKN